VKRLPLVRSALVLSASWSAGAAALALLAGAVRVMPWLLERDVPFRVALPFARSLLAIAVEAALMVGWPIGFALACHRFSSRGEARVLALLGERPGTTTARLLPQALGFAALVAFASAIGGADASAPGRVANDLVDQGRSSCDHASSAAVYTVPLVGAAWLCTPGRPARLYGHGPGAMSGVSFTAEQAHIAGDMRRIDLDEATLMLGPNDDAPRARIHSLTLRGFSPWASAATLGPVSRPLVTSLSALVAAMIAAWACLRRFARAPVVALAVGAAGPLAALGAIRSLERLDAPVLSFAAVPVVAAAASGLVVLFAVLLGNRRAASKRAWAT
jgi:hypothetical protein